MLVRLNTKFFLISYFFIFISSIFIFYFQSVLFEFGVVNIVFVDGNTYIEAMQGFISNQREILEQKAAWLMYAIYYIPTFFLGVFGALIFNYILLGYFFHKYPYKSMHILLLLLFTFFYIISAFLPNKEILVLISTLLYLLSIQKEKYIYAFLIGIVSFFIRDGHGILLILTSLLLFTRFPFRLGLLLVFGSVVFLDSYLHEIADYIQIFALQRMLWIVDSMEVTYLPYIVRIFATVTNLGARVPIFDLHNLYATGLSLYLAGIGIFIAFLSSLNELIFRYKSNEKFVNFLATFYLFSVLFISISPLIQPRYLIPIAFIYLALNFNLRKNNKGLFVLFLLSFIFLLLLRIIYTYTVGLPSTESFELEYNNLFYGGYFLND